MTAQMLFQRRPPTRPGQTDPNKTDILRHGNRLRPGGVASPANRAVMDMIALAFFFLLRPGEYTATKSDATPFRMQDVQLFVDGRLDPMTAPLVTIETATFTTLTFTSQKNGV